MKIEQGRLVLFGLNLSKKFSLTVIASLAVYLAAKTGLSETAIQGVLEDILMLVMTWVAAQAGVDIAKVLKKDPVPKATLIPPDGD